MALYMFEKYNWKRGAINFMAHSRSVTIKQNIYKDYRDIARI